MIERSNQEPGDLKKICLVNDANNQSKALNQPITRTRTNLRLVTKIGSLIMPAVRAY
jgi:hypothetical protein